MSVKAVRTECCYGYHMEQTKLEAVLLIEEGGKYSVVTLSIPAPYRCPDSDHFFRSVEEFKAFASFAMSEEQEELWRFCRDFKKRVDVAYDKATEPWIITINLTWEEAGLVEKFADCFTSSHSVEASICIGDAEHHYSTGATEHHYYTGEVHEDEEGYFFILHTDGEGFKMPPTARLYQRLAGFLM